MIDSLDTVFQKCNIKRDLDGKVRHFKVGPWLRVDKSKLLS